MGKHLTIEQAAELLSVSLDTIRRMLPRLGAIDLNRGTKGRRLIRIPEDRLNAYLRECEIAPPIRQARPYRLERRRA